MVIKKKKVSLNTVIREWILTNRYKISEFSEKFDYEWDEIHYNRMAVTNLLLTEKRGARYLEIGCAGNDLFDAVMAEEKIGVDPRRGGTHRMTSDAFFSTYDGGAFDLVFIDGLHLYQQVRRDLDGALRVLKPGGWIAIHDMLPRDWLEEHVPQIRTRGWTGDGWKVAFELLASPDVEFPDLSATLRDERFGYLFRHFALLPVVGYHQAAAWITARRARLRGDAPAATA
jgi:SAM-dependent methyltransferase